MNNSSAPMGYIVRDCEGTPCDSFALDEAEAQRVARKYELRFPTLAPFRVEPAYGPPFVGGAP